MLTFVKNTTFLLFTCATLAVTTAGLAIKTVSLTTQVAGLSASAATAALAQRKANLAAVARIKAKARLRRIVAAIPVAGLAAAAEFERRDFLEWQANNPEGTFGQYSCEVATVSAEVIDEVLQEVPEIVRPSPETVIGLLPECSK